MLKLDSYELIASGYYLVKIHKSFETNSAFQMPESESGELAVGEIILSGETALVRDTLIDLEFFSGDIVVFRRHTGNTIEIQLENEEDGSKYKILPHDSVIMKVKDSENE